MKKKTAGKDAKAGKLLAVRTQERAQLVNQIQGFRITDRSDARENNKITLFTCYLMTGSISKLL